MFAIIVLKVTTTMTTLSAKFEKRDFSARGARVDAQITTP